MKHVSHLLTALVISCVIVAPIFGEQAQLGVQEFAYIRYDSPETATVLLLDPVRLSVTPLTTISANPGERINSAYLSPMNEWLVVQFASGQTFSLRLLNLSSGEIVNVIDNITFPPRPLTINSDFNVFAWSPNGQYFAFHTQFDEGGQNLFVYNVQSRTLENIGAAGENQYQLSWSPTGNQLAFVSLDCDERDCANASLVVYGMTLNAVERTIDLTAYAGNQATESMSFCQLDWSAEGTAISFANVCDGSVLGATREIRVVDVANGRLAQATSLTPTNIAPANSLFNAELDTLWANDNQLFIGETSVRGELMFSSDGITALGTSNTNQTTQYDRRSQSVSLIDSRRLGLWARANDQVFAYVVNIYSLNSDNNLILSGGRVETASFDGQTLSPLASGPSGCLLSWNRSGDTLAYVARDVAAVRMCDPTFDTLHFLTNGELHTFESAQQAAVLGWFTQSQMIAGTPPTKPTSAAPLPYASGA